LIGTISLSIFIISWVCCSSIAKVSWALKRSFWYSATSPRCQVLELWEEIHNHVCRMGQKLGLFLQLSNMTEEITQCSCFATHCSNESPHGSLNPFNLHLFSEQTLHSQPANATNNDVLVTYWDIRYTCQSKLFRKPLQFSQEVGKP
jgi:hypothetical protein